MSRAISNDSIAACLASRQSKIVLMKAMAVYTGDFEFIHDRASSAGLVKWAWVWWGRTGTSAKL